MTLQQPQAFQNTQDKFQVLWLNCYVVINEPVCATAGRCSYASHPPPSVKYYFVQAYITQSQHV